MIIFNVIYIYIAFVWLWCHCILTRLTFHSKAVPLLVNWYRTVCHGLTLPKVWMVLFHFWPRTTMVKESCPWLWTTDFVSYFHVHLAPVCVSACLTLLNPNGISACFWNSDPKILKMGSCIFFFQWRSFEHMEMFFSIICDKWFSIFVCPVTCSFVLMWVIIKVDLWVYPLYNVRIYVVDVGQCSICENMKLPRIEASVSSTS